MKKEMTIEDLAMITQQGFVGLETRMDKRFNQMEEKFDDRSDRIEHILYRGHDNRIEKLEDKIAQIQVILGRKLA